MVLKCLAGTGVPRLTLTKITSFHLVKILWETKRACNHFLNLFPPIPIFFSRVGRGGRVEKEYLFPIPAFDTLLKATLYCLYNIDSIAQISQT